MSVSDGEYEQMHNFVADRVVDVLGLTMSNQPEKIKVVNSQHTLRMYDLKGAG